MLTRLKPGDGVLDIGGHIGVLARQYAAAVGPTGHVVSVEPDPDSAHTHRAQSAEYPQIEVIEAAVASSTGRCALYRDSQDRQRNSLWRANVLQGGGESVPVDMRRLDDLAGRVRRLAAIKLDAQGAEGHILHGGVACLLQRSLIWWVEFWPGGLRAAGTDPDDFIQMWADHGWQPDGQTWDLVRGTLAGCRDPHSAIDVLLVQA